MDRRQQKTRAAVFQAFSRLLEQKQFNHITVQEIIDEANIGRSTFYAHFETKDELLRALCTDIFLHVFSEEQHSEETHTFSSADSSLRTKLTHLLYHLRDNKKNIAGILFCESKELFLRYFKEYLSEMFSRYLDELPAEAPSDFILNHLAGSFAEAVIWWFRDGAALSPEEVAGYYLSLVRMP